MRTRTDGTGQADGQRLASRHTLMSVRAFYLDLACWAAEDPARWGQWAVPSPVSKTDTETRKEDRRRKSRMDSRTRERLPVLPVLARSAAGWRDQTASTLRTALAVPPGATFTADGRSFTRTAPRKSVSRTWALDSDGTRHDLTWEEDHAFWTWAIIEVLRATGIFSCGQFGHAGLPGGFGRSAASQPRAVVQHVLCTYGGGRVSRAGWHG
jgi:hypothetical protein